MRYLHHVAAHEQFVASGKYIQAASGQHTRYEESWTMHELEGGAKLIRIDQDARFVDQADNGQWSRLAEILRNPEGRIERINVRYTAQKARAGFGVMKTDYTFLDTYAQISRRVDDAQAQYTELALPAGTYIRLLDFTLYWGEALTLAHQQDCSQMPIFVMLFKPKLEPARVVTGALPDIEEAAEDSIQRGDETINVMRYRTGGDRMVWVDERRIPLKMTMGRTQITETLTNYAHR